MANRVKFSQDFWQTYAADLSTLQNGKKALLLAEIERKTGLASQTIYRHLKANGWSSGKKRRSNAGIPEQYIPIIHKIESLYIQPISKDGTLNIMPLAKIIDEYLTPDEVQLLPGLSRLHEILRQRGTSRRDAKKQSPHIVLKSPHSNYCQQLDASICRYYLDRDKDKIIAIGRGEDYKNKDFWKDQRKVKIYRWVLTDHLSQAFFVMYFDRSRSVEIAEFLYHAWKYKDNFIFHGLPKYLFIDNDTALRSHQMLRLYEYFGITVPNIEPFSARVKGSVEKMMHIWEIWFESALIHQKPQSIEELNQWAYNYAIKFQNRNKHSRHGMTRFAKWHQKISSETLRERPDYKTYQSLLHSDPETRTVNGAGIFSFKNMPYKLKGIYNTKIDITIHPFQYETDRTVTIQYPSRTVNQRNYQTCEIQTLSVQPYKVDSDGNPLTAVPVGEYKGYQRNEKNTNLETVSKNREKIDMTQFKPYDNLEKQVEDLPTFIPKTGTVITPISAVSIAPRVYTKLQFKAKLIEVLKRPLKDSEIEHIARLEQTEFRQADIDEFTKTDSQNNSAIQGG